MASSLRFGLNAKDPVHIKKALADANDFWSKHASMHKLGAIHLYHELSNVFIEYILQHDLEKSLAFRTGLFRLYHIDQFDNWGQVFDYFNSVADAILSLSVNAEQNSRHQTLQRIKDYIQANLNRNLTLNEIASSVCYNSSHVSRFFHQMTGQTISQYILQQRMEEACRCLSCENDSIQAISEHLGFDSAQYFSNVFKKYTGVSPRDYRNGIRS
ncbi:MAG: helix-turn-helix transcriptional regulator [Lachnospiraceae bacterium]